MSTIGGNPLDNSGGVAAYYYIVGDIFGYDCASGDDGIFANGYTRTEDGADVDPGILNLGPYQHMVFYHHPAWRENRSTLVDGYMLSYSHPAAAITIER